MKSEHIERYSRRWDDIIKNDRKKVFAWPVIINLNTFISSGARLKKISVNIV